MSSVNHTQFTSLSNIMWSYEKECRKRPISLRAAVCERRFARQLGVVLVCVYACMVVCMIGFTMYCEYECVHDMVVCIIVFTMYCEYECVYDMGTWLIECKIVCIKYVYENVYECMHDCVYDCERMFWVTSNLPATHQIYEYIKRELYSKWSQHYTRANTGRNQANACNINIWNQYVLHLFPFNNL